MCSVSRFSLTCSRSVSSPCVHVSHIRTKCSSRIVIPWMLRITSGCNEKRLHFCYDEQKNTQTHRCAENGMNMFNSMSKQEMTVDTIFISFEPELLLLITCSMQKCLLLTLWLITIFSRCFCFLFPYARFSLTRFSVFCVAIEHFCGFMRTNVKF